jgi:hypothetical protein
MGRPSIVPEPEAAFPAPKFKIVSDDLKVSNIEQLNIRFAVIENAQKGDR